MNKLQPAFVWPSLLEPPPDDVLLVYLDMNHWIGLAKASIGHPQGESLQSALEACRAARAQGIAVFVLSGTIYAEMLKIKDPAQRLDLAQVMEELTDFATLISRVAVMECELSALLDPTARLPSPLSKVPLVGRGIRHAYGLSSGISIVRSSGEDATAELREEMGDAAFDRMMEEMFLKAERSMLRGPADADEEQTLRALGYFPESPRGVTEGRAAQEREFKAILDSDPHWRRGRLRDLVSCRELEIEFQNMLPRALRERGLTLDEVITGPESGRAFVRAMPSTEVSIEIKTAWHRNGEREWTANDIYDIDALALAVPYCDVVVTEKACRHILTVACLPERMCTAVLDKLSELPRMLTERKPKQRFGPIWAAGLGSRKTVAH
jgi:hypothetical protein